MDRRRFTRQLRLAEIGDAGQAKLLEARVRASSDVERAYLELAGVAVADDGATHEVDPDALGLRHPAAREVGESALRALAAIRAILGVR